jgi:hypothetical protein
VDLWLNEDLSDYQTVISEPNQKETYTIKNVELKTSREKKKKTKDGELTYFLSTAFSKRIPGVIRIIIQQHCFQNFPSCLYLLVISPHPS